MFAYCNNSPIKFLDSTGARMEFANSDGGGPVAFPSPSGGFAYGMTAPIAPDSPENIWNNLQDDLEDLSVVAGVTLTVVGFAGSLGIIALPKVIALGIEAVGVITGIVSAIKHFKNR